MNTVRIIIMAKTPIAGAVKTRLSKQLGIQGSALLATHMLRYTIEQALAANLGPVELCINSTPAHSFWQTFKLDKQLICTKQVSGDLGCRLFDASQRASAMHMPYILIGTDCVALNTKRLKEAAFYLTQYDSIMVPTYDGGYALLGLQRHLDAVFDGIPWSTEHVAAVTRQRLKGFDYSLKEFAPLHDIDEPSDLQWVPKAWLHDAQKNKQHE